MTALWPGEREDDVGLDEVTFRDDDGKIMVQFSRLSGRPTIYIGGPGIEFGKVSDRLALALADLIRDTLRPEAKR